MGSTSGNRFRLGSGNIVCPKCHQYPPLVAQGGRLVPHCDRCGGLGQIPKPVDGSDPEWEWESK